MEDGDDSSLHLPLLGPRGGGAGEPAPRGASLGQTTANIVNIYVGLGLLTMPYACMKGGWLALGVLVLLIPLFATTGQLICSAFDLMPPGQQKTFPELGRAAAGKAGMRAVFCFSSLELFGATIVLLMVCWQMLELLLPTEGLGPLRPLHLAAALSSACLLPLLFVELRRLGPLSMLGTCSTAMVLVMVLALLWLDPQRAAMPQQPPPSRHVASAGVIQSLGIFALSCSAHSTLPALRSSMHKQSRFPAALSLSFAAMMLCYCSLASCGYWYWGDAASPLVTVDLAANSYYSRHAVLGLPIDRLLAIFVLVSCLTKYPGLNVILQDMILSVLPASRDASGAFRSPQPWAARTLRLAIWGAGTLLALTAYSALGAVLSLLGGLCSITCSLLLPTAFYAVLSWRRLRWHARAALAALMLLGASLVLLVTAINVCDLAEACRTRMRGTEASEQPAAALAGWGAGLAKLLPGAVAI